MLKLQKLQSSTLDPLEQFDLFGIHCVFFTNLHYSVLIVCFGLGFFFFFTGGYVGYNSRKPNLVLFRDKTFGYFLFFLKENLNIKIVVFFPVLYLTFAFLLCANVFGLVPYTYAITGSAAVSFFFSITFFVGVSLAGYRANKDAFFQILLPAGVPLILAPFLIVIEAASYFVKVFSLGGRLFANMMAGHSLLKILGTMTVGMLLSEGSPIGLHIFPVIIVLLVSFLELAVAFLQAYVFVILVCIYLNDAMSIH
jgi:F-type H+-transporting ATPase subunit a